MVKRLKRVLNLVKNVSIFTFSLIVSIFTITAFVCLFVAPPFIALVVVRYDPPFLGNPDFNFAIAFIIDVVWLFALGYIILPLYDRIRDKNFEELAGGIVAYRARKWKAKLGKIDEIEDE